MEKFEVKFEVGNVYVDRKDPCGFFLCVDTGTFLGRKKGEWISKGESAFKKRKALTISVGDLGKKWGVSVKEIDAISREYFRMEGCSDRKPPSFRTGQRLRAKEGPRVYMYRYAL